MSGHQAATALDFGGWVRREVEIAMVGWPQRHIDDVVAACIRARLHPALAARALRTDVWLGPAVMTITLLGRRYDAHPSPDHDGYQLSSASDTPFSAVFRTDLREPATVSTST